MRALRRASAAPEDPRRLSRIPADDHRHQIATVSAQLKPLGAPTAFVFSKRESRDRLTVYTYRVVTPVATLHMTVGYDAAGKIARILFVPDT